jgi:hypothetical protein
MAMADEMFKAFGHQIRLIDENGKLWTGYVSGFVPDYDNEEDDEPGYNELDLDVTKPDGHIVHYAFRESEIKSIEIID